MIEYLAYALTALIGTGLGLLIYRQMTGEMKGSGLIFVPTYCCVGIQYDKVKRELFIFPLPFIGLVIRL
jgi:hypothetical protein